MKSCFNNLPDKISIICHDAGSANIIFGWLVNDQSFKRCNSAVKILIDGPALNIFKINKLNNIILCSTFEDLLKDTELLISGTGWTNFELNCLFIAKQKRIRTISVIDHWINYRARFKKGDGIFNPKEIWVTDLHAYKKADKLFEKCKVILKPNYYLQNILINIRKFESIKKKQSEYYFRILYLSEPIRENWGANVKNGEFKALDYFIKNISKIKINDNYHIKLRPHPSDEKNKYKEWLNLNSNYNISIDKFKDMAESIAWSDAVIGCQTYGMVVALNAGKKVFTSIPPNYPDCILPQSGIKKISKLT